MDPGGADRTDDAAGDHTARAGAAPATPDGLAADEGLVGPDELARRWLRRRRRQILAVLAVLVTGVVAIPAQSALAGSERDAFFDDAVEVTGSVLSVAEGGVRSVPVRVSHPVDGGSAFATFDAEQATAASLAEGEQITVYVDPANGRAAHIVGEVDAFGMPARLHEGWAVLVFMAIAVPLVALVGLSAGFAGVGRRLRRGDPWRPVTAIRWGDGPDTDWLMTDEPGAPTYTDWGGRLHAAWLDRATPGRLRLHVAGDPEPRQGARSLLLIERPAEGRRRHRSAVAVAKGPTVR